MNEQEARFECLKAILQFRPDIPVDDAIRAAGEAWEVIARRSGSHTQPNGNQHKGQ